MKWTYRFLDLAEHIAGWSRDPSSKVGAVIVRPDKTVASLGFNGFPRGVIDAESFYLSREIKLARMVHAELNAILCAHEPLRGYTIFIHPFHPCAQCAAAIIQSGIERVVIREAPAPERWAADFGNAGDMLAQAEVPVVRVPPR